MEKNVLKYQYINNKKQCDVVGYRKLTKNVWADPSKELVDKWVELADIIIEARDQEGSLQAFLTASRLDADTLYVITTIVNKPFQNSGVASIMLRRALNGFIRTTNIFKKSYIAFRTINPSLYEKVYGKFDVFPDYKKQNRLPSKQEYKIFDVIVKKLKVDDKLDRDGFIIFNATKHYPALAYEIDKIPWSKNNEINRFFGETLGLLKRNGNAFVVVCGFGFLKKLIILARGINK